MVSEGLRLGFRANRQDLLAKLASISVPGSSPTEFDDLDFVYSLEAAPKQQSYRAYFGSRALIRCTNVETALDFIASSVQHTISKHSRQHLFLHAGVIGWRGKAVLIPGRTCSGKSTLVQALIRVGAVYFSDEFARIDAHGLVHPFPRPLSLRSPAGRESMHPEEEGVRIAAGPCRAGAIIATQYKPGGVWHPSRISAGQAALELLSNTVAVRSEPAKALRYMSMLASTAIAIRSPRGDAEATASLLLQMLDRLVN